MTTKLKLYRQNLFQNDCRRQSTFDNVKDFRRQLSSLGTRDLSQNAFSKKDAEDEGEDSGSMSSVFDTDRPSYLEEEDEETETQIEKTSVIPPVTPIPLPVAPPKSKFCPDIDFVHVCFFSLNIFFLVTGTMLFAFGVLVVTNTEEVGEVTKSFIPARLANVDFAGLLKQGSRGLVVSGVCIVLIGCLGLLGMCTGSQPILYAYGGLIVLSIGAELIGCLLFVIFRQNIFADIKEAILNAMRTDYDGMTNSSSLFSQSVDTFQVYFECCGISDWRDFQDTPWFYTINNLPEPTTTTEPTCIWVPVTYNDSDPAFSSADGNDNFTGPTTPRPILTTCVYNISSTTTVAPENTTISRTQLRTFPTTCCKTVAVSVLNVATDTQARLLDPDCPYKNASLSNPNTAVGCFETFKTWLFNQIVVILSLVFTIVGLEVSAVSNTYSVIKELNKKKDKANLLSSAAPLVSALTGITTTTADPPDTSQSPGDSGSKKDYSPDTVENEFQSNLAAFVGGEVILPSDERSLTPPEAASVAPTVQPVLMMGPTGELTVLTLPTAAPVAPS